MKLFEDLSNAWHNLTHDHWEFDSEEAAVQVRICISRHWLPWLMNVTRISVAIIPYHGSAYVQGRLNLDQLTEVLAMNRIDDMRIFMVANGNGTIGPLEWEEKNDHI